MKVLVSDNISPKGVELLKKAGLGVDVKIGMKPDELKACIGEYHGLIIRSATKVTADIIDAATNLRVIGRAGSGLDNVDKAAASKKGIVVMNTPGGNTITTAEHAIALLFAVARMIPQATASMKQYRWEKKKFMGVELFNKTLGIIGLGAIGSQVAKKALGLEMNVIAYDPFLNEERARELGIRSATLDEIFSESDFITIHSPLTPETKELINASTIAKMKNGVRIINCARGGIINEQDLYDALKSGKVAAAALDVFAQEPPGEHPLICLENFACTPHLGASTEEAQENVAIAIAEQVADYLVTGTIRNAVNFPSIPSDQVPRLQPYITLAEKLGSFASQLFEGGASEITIEFGGDAASVNTAPVAVAAIKGFLTPILIETVNFVNAPIIAKERGIEVKEVKTAEAGDYHNIIRMRIKSKDRESSVSGTLFSKKDPRIILIDNFEVEIVPDGVLLIIYNHDRPGVIGSIGMTLAKHAINIARMHFGRESAGGMAISVVSVDTAPAPEVNDEIRQLPNIVSLKQINL